LNHKAKTLGDVHLGQFSGIDTPQGSALQHVGFIGQLSWSLFSRTIESFRCLMGRQTAEIRKMKAGFFFHLATYTGVCWKNKVSTNVFSHDAAVDNAPLGLWV
jgi:hypothetical protein